MGAPCRALDDVSSPIWCKPRLVDRGGTADNGEMVLLEAALVIGLVWAVVYGTIRLLADPRGAPASTTPSRWRPAHHDVKGQTRVVLQKVSERDGKVLDEHIIATITVGDPDYDAKFLTAMATARERRALFEAEEKE
jgi:hypothetical protein